jgi:hypothetical protein
VEEREGEREEV